jgi:Zn-dependent M28 family amino/carboxypeptidase
MTDWIGETFTSDVGWTHLERLVDVDGDGNRMAGSPGEAEAARLTRDALAEVGCRDARLESFEIQGWERGDATLGADGITLECIALPRGPAGEVTGELVDVGHGMPADFADAALDGAVALASSTVPDDADRFVHRTEKYYRAVDAGAAAFVFRNHVEGCLPPTGSVGSGDDPVGPIPAVGVSKEVGARLERRAVGDDLSVSVDCGTPTATSHNVHADLGPDTDEAVWLTAHVDSHDVAEGAMDNGAGTATVVEAARALAAREDDLDTRVRLVVFGSEEVGLVGSEREAARADPDAVRAVLNVDSNVHGRTLRIHTHDSAALSAAVEAVSERFDHPISTPEDVVPHSDHWPFVHRGVPGCMISGESAEAGRGWGHTEADTLDKLDPRNLREQAVLLTDLVVETADADRDVARLDRDAVAEALEEQGDAEGMRYTGGWPF